MVSTTYVYVQRKPPELKTPAYRNMIGRPASCVITQQYSSATILSLHFHSRKEKLSQLLKIIFYFFF